MTISADGPLPLAARRLGDAVHALADPLPVWDDGVCRWSDPLYVRLRAALTGRTVSARRRAHGARLPCRTDVLALLCQIDAAVGGWEPHGKTTVDRLRQLAARGWRPMDCDLINGYSDQIERWAVAVGELLELTPRVYLPTPCPRCGAAFAYRRDDGGERRRTRALRVSETGCTCLACGSFWGPERFEWLARLLGCPALPA